MSELEKGDHKEDLMSPAEGEGKEKERGGSSSDARRGAPEAVQEAERGKRARNDERARQQLRNSRRRHNAYRRLVSDVTPRLTIHNLCPAPPPPQFILQFCSNDFTVVYRRPARKIFADFEIGIEYKERM